MYQKMRSLLPLCALLLAPAISYAGPSPQHYPSSCASIKVESLWRGSLPEYPHQGFLWIEGQESEPYQLRVYNHCPSRILAVVSVDGLNVIDGTTASAYGAGYIVNAGTSVAIKGWRKNLQQSAQFYFTYPQDAYASRVQKDQNLGIIGAAFFHEQLRTHEIVPLFPLPEQMQTPSKRKGSASDGASPAAAEKSTASTPGVAGMRAPVEEPSLGTGHGAKITDRAVKSSFERKTHPFTIISLRYDSTSNLIERGVLHKHTPLIPRVPNAFPSDGFVPDPR